MSDSVSQRMRAFRQLGSEARLLMRDRLAAPFCSPRADPVIILGFQKSGTSAIAGLLGQATGLTTTIDFVGAREPYIRPLRMGEEDFSSFVKKNARPFSRAIVKEPNLSIFLPLILEYYDNPRIVFVVRQPAANIKSILDRLELDATGKYAGRAEWIPPNRTWAEMLGHGDPGQWDPVVQLADRWVEANNQALRFRDRIELIRYEDFNQNKLGVIENLAASVALGASHSIEKFADHQFQPAGDKSRSVLDFFSPEQLDMINAHTRDLCLSFGY